MTDAITRDNYADANARAIDGWNADGWEWGTSITHEDYLRACQGDWEMLLTPTKPVPHEWYPADMTGLRVLGLACGGAQQMPIFAALGAVCTVLDYTPSQLESERMVAQREGYEIEIVRADMSKPLPFEDASFDMIFHPVSNCYIEEVKPLWLECNRILKPGGRLLAGLDNGFGYVFDYPTKSARSTACRSIRWLIPSTWQRLTRLRTESSSRTRWKTRFAANCRPGSNWSTATRTPMARDACMR